MFARRIAVIGTGYVGLTTGACLASLGHHVVYADVNEAKIERLRTGAGGCEPSCPPLVAVPLSYSNDEPVVAIIDAARSTSMPDVQWRMTGRTPANLKATTPPNIDFTGFSRTKNTCIYYSRRPL